MENQNLDVNSIVNLTDGARELLTRRTAHAEMSDKYKTLTTANTLQPFFDAGYKISAVQYGKRRKNNVEGQGLAGAHIVRLRHDALKIGNDSIELVISNSYDGSCKWSISLGIFRLVCTNGLTVGQSVFSRTIKHVGTEFYDNVKVALKDAESNIETLKRSVERIKSVQLTDNQVKEYARAIFQERLNGVKNITNIDLDASLKVERPDDAGNGLWEVLNVVQEKLLRGGVEYTHLREVKNDDGQVIELKPSHRTTKAVFNTKETMRLNQLTFDRALEFANAA